MYRAENLKGFKCWQKSLHIHHLICQTPSSSPPMGTKRHPFTTIKHFKEALDLTKTIKNFNLWASIAKYL